jgi:hypothetical protein
MARHQVNAAKREANSAAAEAQKIREELTANTALEKEKSNREKLKAQRVLMRSIRAGSGGFFETDQGAKLGGSGVIG